MTDYTILKLTEVETGTGVSGSAVATWREHAQVKANSSAAAIRAAKATEGTYIAVPSRSWKPLKVKVETTTKIKIG